MSEVARIVEQACTAETNVFGYGIWTHHITSVVKTAKSLAPLFDADREIVEIAALLHDYASIKDVALYPEHHLHGPIEAKKVLRQLGYPSTKIAAVCEAIAGHRASVGVEPRTREAECLANADGVAHLENVPSLLHLVYVRRQLGIDEGAAWVRAKLDRSWTKLAPAVKLLVREDYEAALRMLATVDTSIDSYSLAVSRSRLRIHSWEGFPGGTTPSFRGDPTMARTDKLSLRADRIFAAALDLGPDERRAFVDRECDGDLELRVLVARLLANVETGDDPLARTELLTGGGMAGPLWDRFAESLSDDPDLAGMVIDRYRILHEIGRGGMAVVYLAERADRQFDQRVALKLIKRGTDTDEVVRRFRQERQIMALTQHPNIARLLDGGSTTEGRPYFVMEHVAGRPIDRYCDEERLTVRQRLELFVEVARAVAHAHRNLVVHRDIKPSNILVSDDGEVKLLDFGIAKFLDPEATVELTRSQMRFLTPAYASPEQVRGIPASTASDIYQLGLLLYLLITGHSPYRPGSQTSQDLARAITDEPPTRPSTVIGATQIAKTASAEELSAAAAVFEKRRTTLVRLRRELNGDLDNIVLMTLRKEPERRYRSALSLVDDIGRYLAGRPVTARPSTFLYRAGKFIRRHALGVATVATMMVVVAGLITFYTIRLAEERDRANQEAARASREAVVANQVADFLVGLFEVSDPNEARGNVVTAREILDRGAEHIAGELDQDPLTRARLMRTIGKVYQNLGLFDPAMSLLEQALQLEEESSGSELANALNELGNLHRQLGRYTQAEALYRRALPIIESWQEPQRLAELINNLAQLAMDQGQHDEAEELFSRSLRMLEKAHGPEASDVAEALNNLGLLFRTDQRPAAAEPLFQRALPILEKTLGEDHPHVAITLNNLALAYRDQQKYAAAEPLYRRSLAILEKVLGPDHPHVGIALHNVADLIADQGGYDEAEPLYLRSQTILVASLGAEHPNVATSLHSLADLYSARGDYDLAEAAYQKSLAIREQVLGLEHPKVAQSLEGYGDVLQQTGRPKSADAMLVRAQAIRDKYGY